MRPSSITNPGALLIHRLGPSDPDITDGPPSPDCCDVDPGNVPDRADRENGGQAFSLSTPTAFARIQSAQSGSGGVPATITTNWDSPPTPGNRLFAAYTERNGAGNTATAPLGWDLVGYFEWIGFDQGGSWLWTKIAATEPAGVTITKGQPHNAALAIWEVAGVGALVDTATVNTSSADSASVGPADVDDDDSYGVGFFAGGTEFTVGATWSEIEAGLSGGIAPGWFVEDKTVDTPSATATAVVLNTSGIWGGMVATFAPGGEAAWVIPQPNVIDDDDATFGSIDGAAHAGEFLRFDLGAEYRIQRLRYVLGLTNAGPATITLDAWNEADESDRVTLRSTDIVGTGGLTPQTVTDEWYTADSYRYFQIDGPAEVVRWFTVSLFEATVQIAHEHPTTVITTDETDTDLVLHPDGSGGVEWGPGGTVDPDTIKDAGRWELAVVPGSPPDSLYADGDWLYIWVPGP